MKFSALWAWTTLLWFQPIPCRAASPAVQTSPQTGEIALWGYVDSFDLKAGVLELRSIAFALPNGRVARLRVAKLKKLSWNARTSLRFTNGALCNAGALRRGLPLFAIGPDLGSGSPLPARELICGTPVEAKTARRATSGVATDKASHAAYLVRKFPLRDYTLAVSYERGGHTASQAVQRGASAVYAFGGGYFQPGSKRTIDYVVVNGKRMDDYRWDWARPVIAVSDQKIQIIRPGYRQDVKGSFDFALATDFKATRRRAIAGRQIFGLTKTEMVFVRCYTTEAAARRFIDQLGLKDFVFLDGGSSTPPGARIPTRLVVVPRVGQKSVVAALQQKPKS